MKEQHTLNCDAWIALPKSIQSEFQDFKTQISRHDKYLKSSIEEIRSEVWTGKHELKSQILGQGDRVDAYFKNSIEEIKGQVQTANNDMKAHMLRQEDRAESHGIYLKNSLQEGKVQD